MSRNPPGVTTAAVVGEREVMTMNTFRDEAQVEDFFRADYVDICTLGSFGEQVRIGVFSKVLNQPTSNIRPKFILYKRSLARDAMLCSFH